MAYVFDDVAYHERVAPGIKQLVHIGTTDPWLEKIFYQVSTEFGELDLPHIRQLGFSFDEVCTYLDQDFAFSDSEGDQWSYTWEDRACVSASCSAKGVCPLHRSRQSTSPPEDFNRLLEACVVDQCLSDGQFMGRTVSPLWYTDTLVDIGYNLTHPIFDYLKKLEYRGFVVGYQFSNSDGIHGWLTAQETEAFHLLLQEIDLPQFESSFEAMELFRQPTKLYYKTGYRQVPAYVAPHPYSFGKLSLAFLRTIAALAATKQQGVLWGNDISYSKDN